MNWLYSDRAWQQQEPPEVQDWDDDTDDDGPGWFEELLSDLEQTALPSDSEAPC